MVAVSMGFCFGPSLCDLEDRTELVAVPLQLRTYHGAAHPHYGDLQAYCQNGRDATQTRLPVLMNKTGIGQQEQITGQYERDQ